ncbi:MAG: sugar transferase, partial [Bdellovibrionales bacterium]|nr:sugar transferase [Bdellovibrionales bacterium]
HMKRLFDVLFSALGLLVLGIPLLFVAFLVWLHDRANPFYASIRIGKDFHPFTFLKLRSMVVDADSLGGDSTAADDRRITPIGSLVRRTKFDELPQLFNVLLGDMSLVGPRPNVKRAVEGYSLRERELLSVRPGITDISSLVFADEGKILEGSMNPEEAYERLIRPWKSQFGLLYVSNSPSLILDIQLLFLTLAAFVSRKWALEQVSQLVKRCGGSEDLIEVASRSRPLSESCDVTEDCSSGIRKA